MRDAHAARPALVAWAEARQKQCVEAAAAAPPSLAEAMRRIPSPADVAALCATVAFGGLPELVTELRSSGAAATLAGAPASVVATAAVLLSVTKPWKADDVVTALKKHGCGKGGRATNCVCVERGTEAVG